MDELPLLELFTGLQEAGLPLGIPDYEALIRAVQKGYGLPDRAALARLCQTLWIRSPDEQRLLDYYFEQLIGSVSVSQVNQVEPETATNIARQSRKRLIVASVGLLSLVLISVGFGFWYNNSQRKPPQASPSLLPSLTPKPVPTGEIPTTPTVTPPNPQNRSSNPLVWILLLILALGTGSFWLFRILMNRRRKMHEQPVESVASDNSAKLASELLRDTHDAVQVAQAVQQITTKNTNRSHDRFIFSGDYLPVTQRQMKQSWRHLRRMVREGVPTELDVEGTVQKIAQEGMLLNPILMPRRTNHTELVLLIDQDGSMVPFHSLSDRLVETALRGGRLGKAGAYYFHNCPNGYLYHDPLHQQSVTIEEALKSFQRDRTAVLIFSDAGAARGGLSWERVELTTTFLRQLKQHVRYVAWLNPMPHSRWSISTAREIALQVPMFEATRQGLDDAIDALRGRYKPLIELTPGEGK